MTTPDIQPVPDLRVRTESNILILHPTNPKAHHWLSTELESEGWQWLGSGLCVDLRMAPDILTLAVEAGLTVEAE